MRRVKREEDGEEEGEEGERESARSVELSSTRVPLVAEI